MIFLKIVLFLIFSIHEVPDKLEVTDKAKFIRQAVYQPKSMQQHDKMKHTSRSSNKRHDVNTKINVMT